MAHYFKTLFIIIFVIILNTVLCYTVNSWTSYQIKYLVTLTINDKVVFRFLIIPNLNQFDQSTNIPLIRWRTRNSPALVHPLHQTSTYLLQIRVSVQRRPNSRLRACQNRLKRRKTPRSMLLNQTSPPSILEVLLLPALNCVAISASKADPWNPGSHDGSPSRRRAVNCFTIARHRTSILWVRWICPVPRSATRCRERREPFTFRPPSAPSYSR